MLHVKTFFDEPYKLVRGLAFADLRSEPVEEAFFDFSRAMKAVGLPRRVQWLNFVNGEYLDIMREAQQERWEEAILNGEPERIDVAISRATKFVERYLERELPELVYKWQSYLTMPERDSGNESLLGQIEGVAVSSSHDMPDPQRDPPQLTRKKAAVLLGCDTKHLDNLVRKYSTFPQPFQRIPNGHWYFWQHEVLEFKRGELFGKIEQEQRAKKLDSKEHDALKPVEGLKQAPRPKRPAKRIKPKGS